MFGGVGGNGKWGKEVQEKKNRLRGEGGFEGQEGVIAGFVPGPWVSFLGEVQERSGGVRVVGNETSVKVGKSEE